MVRRREYRRLSWLLRKSGPHEHAVTARGTDAGGESRSLAHIPALDGLRGIAILMVILIHSWVTTPASGLDHGVTFFVGLGWSGVDLFFVLSGFLITGILLDAKGGRYYFRSFYLRRVLRIFPLYYAFVAFHFLATAALPHRLARPFALAVPGQELSYVLFLSNFSTAPQTPASLRVLWSLAVEEQFYLAWPFLVWLLSRRWVLRVSIALVLLSFAWRVGVTAAVESPDATFLFTPCQFGAIAAGAAIAAWQRGPGGLDRLLPWARRLLIGVPLVLIPIGAHAVTGDMHFSTSDPLMMTVGLLLLQLFFAATLVTAIAARPSQAATRLLQSRSLRACGRWSYSMYLFHELLIPVVTLVAGRHGSSLVLGSALPKQLMITGVTVGASLGLGALSWRFYEQRFLRLKRFFPMPAQRRPASADQGVLQSTVVVETSLR
jgi:peptidoglycan/LPS O-acetylase OafA/YrhL